MKKALSILLSAAIGFSALCTTAFAANDPSDTEKNSSSKNMVILGDSISTGYNLKDNEYSYADICKDYLGYSDENFYNFAVNGADTFDLYDLLTTDENATAAIANAEVVVVSIGGNDMIDYIAYYLMKFAAQKDPTGTLGFFNEGYSAANVPATPKDASAYYVILNQDGLTDYLTSNALEAVDLLSELKTNLCDTTAGNDGYIPNIVSPNLTLINNKLNELNSDADIIFQTVYQPLQFSKEYETLKFGSGNMSVAARQLRIQLTKVANKYSDTIKALDDIKIADVYAEFTSETTNAAYPNGYGSYFTEIETAGNGRDFHPNRKGHIAIAATVLEQIDKLHDDNGLLVKAYNNLSAAERAAYPAMAYETYELVAGNYAEPITTTSNTTTEPITTTSTTSTEPTTTTTTDTPDVNLGDINEDEIIDARDASIALTEYALNATGGESSLTKEQQEAADVNGDDTIDARDASIILGYYAYSAVGGKGSISEFLLTL